MKYIEAPDEYLGSEKSLFLGGGISNCPDWQKEIVSQLEGLDLVILNPRRNNFDLANKSVRVAQIEWEFRHLRKATARSFWFPKETLCPITLYELGTYSSQNGLFIGIHPKYQRREDIEEQTKLVRPDIKLVYSLDDLAKQISKFF